jgi:lysozyme family protein
MTPNEIIDAIIIRESEEYSDRPADRGGPTKYGVTLAKLSEWRGKPCAADDIKNLTLGEAQELLREEYIVRPGFLGIENQQIRAFAVDCAVNHGVKRAVKLLQEAAHVFTDGIFGPNTRAAVNRMTPAALYRHACALRVELYGEIIAHDPELKKAVIAGFNKLQALNALGWLRRAAEFIKESA